MKNDNLRELAIGGMVWKGLEKIGIQLTQFVIQIVLARLLMPEDYGIIGIVTVFVAVADVFLQQGLPVALIQKKNADEIDYSSVFYVNIIMSVILYVILWLFAPAVALFYNDSSLTLILRILGISIIIGAFCGVHSAILSKRLEFKKSFVRGMFNVGTQGIVGIWLAYQGYGVWALVFSKILGTLVGSIVLIVTVEWKPQMLFSIKRVRNLFKYGSKILGTNILNTVFNNIHSLIIGRYYNKADLGFYQRGQQIPQTIMTAIDGSINEVLFPTLAQVQDDAVRLKGMLRRTMRTSIFVVMPLMLGIVATAESIVKILLTDKWLPCVPYMQLTCIICIFWPFSSRLHAINAIGRSDVTLRISVITKLLTIISILICIKGGIYAIMLGTIVASGIGFAITSYYTDKLLDYTVKELIKDCVPIVALSVSMCLIVRMIALVDMNIYVLTIVQIVAGILIYVVGAKIFKIDSLNYLVHLLMRLFKMK